MQQRKKDFDELGVTIIAIGMLDRKTMLKWLARNKLSGSGIRCVADGSGAVFKTYGVSPLPVNFFIDTEGTVTGSELGFGDSADPLLGAFR